ncbi:hypothetical protein P3T76_003072 [Phytophthora citrophthora]|uniref:Uncharacterized protein n=1 Tax=Phytophthora citrophthora TaxID=4793 RepID=A0AAD9GWR6_9STRA|nr:hypothetical protein P3T76_003072 [Phytophthora citrophthora]
MMDPDREQGRETFAGETSDRMADRMSDHQPGDPAESPGGLIRALWNKCDEDEVGLNPDKCRPQLPESVCRCNLWRWSGGWQ